ncbi:hypothetical protein EKO04_005832 [Ascochyta lentis]|uniref:Uncharacterized protein n=1 Tax=Ascochyta lentis TaxID=205686 RepID=A0A8H7J350_9PLEO|nr:hypothetical protein EKO04_005832 [Ascochyta lentis]
MACLSDEDEAALSETLQLLRKIYLWVTFRTDADVVSVLPDNGSPASAPSSRPLFPLFVTSAPDSAASTPCSSKPSSSQAQPIELSAILLFLHGLADGFLLLLHQRHPFALIIMAHYAVVLQQKDMWWMRGIGEDMLAWVVDGLNEQPAGVQMDVGNTNDASAEWMHWIEWPRKAFKLADLSDMDANLATPGS